MSFELMDKIAELQAEGIIDPEKTPEDLIKEAGLADVLRRIVRGVGGAGEAVGKRVSDVAGEVASIPKKWVGQPKVTTTVKQELKGGKWADKEVKRETVTGSGGSALKRALVWGAGIGAGVKTYEGIGALPSLARRKKSLNAVMESTDIPKDQKQQARKIFEILDTYAPSLAENPLVAQSFVKGILEYGGVLDTRWG
jgi:hypothetical protein